MAERALSELKSKHKNHDIYVLATGPSGSFIAESFLNNKIVIGVNEAWLHFSNLDYLVRKEAARAQAALSSGIPLIISRFNCGSLRASKNGFNKSHEDYYVFDHQDNELTHVDLDVIGTDKIVVSYSTITSAMHIAAYMGAANVILIGHDCGLLDGMQRLPGLPQAVAGDDFHRKFLREIEPQSIAVRERLKQVYGCNVYSLNPFLNFGLEGHKYER